MQVETRTEWISPKLAMQLLGVGSTTIKRWGDEGRLPCIRTAGGHRRFQRSSVERLLICDTSTLTARAESNRWARWLGSKDLGFVRRQVQLLIDSRGDCYAAADFLGQVITDIGELWANGELTVVEEHIAMTKMSQAVAAVSCDFHVAADAMVCHMVTFTGERHHMGLELAQLCLRGEGINGILVGVELPVPDFCDYLQRLETGEHSVALSASVWQTDFTTLQNAYEDVAGACRERGFALILGGNGKWPENIDYGQRCSTFADFKKLIHK